MILLGFAGCLLCSCFSGKSFILTAFLININAFSIFKEDGDELLNQSTSSTVNNKRVITNEVISVTYTTKQKVVLFFYFFSRFDDVTLKTHVVGAEFPNKESVGSIPVEKQLTFCLMSSVALQLSATKSRTVQ